jgi:shikimate kinase
MTRPRDASASTNRNRERSVESDFREERRNGPSVIERVVLLGYMCSGKSTVGESLARRLSWRFLDFDVEIEHRENRSIRSIVEEEGEDAFRAREAALTEEIAAEPSLVIAPGGGWITEPRLLESIRRGTLSIWLHVSPEETARRLREDSIDRPFRDLDDPVGPISEMIAERQPLYRRADVKVPTDHRTPEDIAFEIETLLRTRGCVRR